MSGSSEEKKQQAKKITTRKNLSGSQSGTTFRAGENYLLNSFPETSRFGRRKTENYRSINVSAFS
jgi:hypothetical protein